MQTNGAGAILGVLLGVLACEVDSTPGSFKAYPNRLRCLPGDWTVCTCAGGGHGVQQCGDDESYGTCRCTDQEAADVVQGQDTWQYDGYHGTDVYPPHDTGWTDSYSSCAYVECGLDEYGNWCGDCYGSDECVEGQCIASSECGVDHAVSGPGGSQQGVCKGFDTCYNFINNFCNCFANVLYGNANDCWTSMEAVYGPDWDYTCSTHTANDLLSGLINQLYYTCNGSIEYAEITGACDYIPESY